MKISNEQIIASARRQRQKVLNTIDHSPLNIDHWAPPETVPSKNNGQRSMVNGQWWIVAASLVSFARHHHASADRPRHHLRDPRRHQVRANAGKSRSFTNV